MKEFLNRVASRAMDKSWRMLGLELKITASQLNSIEKIESSPISCFAEVFDIWKRNLDTPFTWATIVEALRSPTVMENALAMDIEEWLKHRY